MSTCGLIVKKLWCICYSWRFILLDDKWLLVSSQVVVSCRKFVKVSLRLRKERSPIVEVRKWLKKTANLSIRELKKTPPKEFLNGDVAPKWE